MMENTEDEDGNAEDDNGNTEDEGGQRGTGIVN
jgi:hypothetical protein